MDSDIEETIEHFQHNQKKAKYYIIAWFVGIAILTLFFFFGAKNTPKLLLQLSACSPTLLV